MSGDKISERPLRDKPYCPYCGAELFSANPLKCWLCHESLAPGESAAYDPEIADRIRLPESRGDNPAWIFFGVLAILLILGLATAGPGILIVLLILATPALIRVVIAASHQASQGRPLTGLDITSTFLSSVGIVAMVGLASFAAFYATCWVVCLGGLALENLKSGRGVNYDWILVASVGAGLIPGGAVAFLLFRRLWPRKG